MYHTELPNQLKDQDPQVFKAIVDEIRRQNNSIELIASENFVSPSVMEAVGSVLTNKYAEGYPSKRYYGGCEYVDVVENLAKERLGKLFGCQEHDYVCNVQPHSGSQANMAVLFALLEPKDTVMGMDLGSGGHLTHGLNVNFSGKLYNVVSYKTNDDGVIDYEQLEELALQHKPKLIIAGASAYARTIHFDKFRQVADKVGAYLMADIAHIAGLVAAGIHPSPIPHAHVITSTTHKTLRGTRGGVIISKGELAKRIDSSIFPGIQGGPLMHVIAGKAVAFGEALKPEFKQYQTQIVINAKAIASTLVQEGINVISGGTDNHMMLVDLRSLDINGKQAQNLLDSVGITVNKNGIPNDPEPPWITSGIRIGTPACTTRGFKEEDAIQTAKLIARTLKHPADEDVLRDVQAKVKELCNKHPLYKY